MKFDSKALVETLKSAGRAVWFAFLAIIITALTGLATDGAVTNATVELGGQTVQVGFLLVTVIGLLIKLLDRYIHKSRGTELNGLAPTVLQK